MGKMSNAPVYFVLGQVRFNTVLALDPYVPAVQDILRKAGYTDFSKGALATINMNLGVPASANQMPVSQMPIYQFLNEPKTTGFVFTQAGLTFQTTEYRTFEPFRDELLFGLRTVHEAVGGLSFSERIGVRFLDAICPHPGEKLSAYLAPSLLGLSDKLNGRKLAQAISETWSTLEKTNLMCRVVIQDQVAKGVAFPPDLQPMTLKVAEKFRDITGLYGILDTDSWCEDRQKFDFDGIKESLVKLHADARRSFNDMATPHALRVWE